MQLSDKDIARFWSYVDRRGQDECWEWKLLTDTHGYARFFVDRKSFLSHRVSFFIAHRSINDSLKICHTCDNPKCVNPNHLFQGTQADNVHDSIHKGRFKFPFETRSHHGMAKLAPSQVKEIIELRKKGRTYAELSKQFGVCETNIYYILSGRSWRNLDRQ